MSAHLLETILRAVEDADHRPLHSLLDRILRYDLNDVEDILYELKSRFREQNELSSQDHQLLNAGLLSLLLRAVYIEDKCLSGVAFDILTGIVLNSGNMSQIDGFDKRCSIKQSMLDMGILQCITDGLRSGVVYVKYTAANCLHVLLLSTRAAHDPSIPELARSLVDLASIKPEDFIREVRDNSKPGSRDQVALIRSDIRIDQLQSYAPRFIEVCRDSAYSCLAIIAAAHALGVKRRCIDEIPSLLPCLVEQAVTQIPNAYMESDVRYRAAEALSCLSNVSLFSTLDERSGTRSPISLGSITFTTITIIISCILIVLILYL